MQGGRGGSATARGGSFLIDFVTRSNSVAWGTG